MVPSFTPKKLVVVLLILVLMGALGWRTWEYNFHPESLPQVVLFEPKINYEHYAVEGQTGEDLRQALDQNGPQDPISQKVRDAYTRWRITWHWPLPGVKHSVDQVQVGLDILVTLPQWVGKEVASPELQKKWETFLTAVKLHEHKHVELVKSNYALVAHELRRALLQDPQVSEEALNQIAMNQIMKIRELDMAYDQMTHNGRTEGVVFP